MPLANRCAKLLPGLALILAGWSGAAAAGSCAPAATIINVTPSITAVGQLTQVSVRLVDQGPFTLAPIGQVRVKLSADERCLATLAGTVPGTAEGTCELRPLVAGITRLLSADYLGDLRCAPMTVSQGQMVNQAATTVDIVVDTPDPSLLNAGFTVSARLQPEFGFPTGTILFDHSGDACTATLPEQSCVFNSTILGAINITAAYSGDANFGGSSSASIGHTVVTDNTFEILSGGAPGVSSGLGAFNGPMGPVFSISDDGRYAIIETLASNLVPGDDNVSQDVYLIDLRSGAFERVSVADDESEGQDASYVGDISADGRYILFASDADNLLGIGNDNNFAPDAFVRDRVAGTTVRVSVGDGAGAELAAGISLLSRRSLSLSADGLLAAFSTAAAINGSDINGTEDCYLRTRAGGAGTSFPLSTSSAGGYGNGSCLEVALNFDGSRAVFVSTSTNIGQVTDFNGPDSDVFLKATDGGQPGTTILLSESVVQAGSTGNFESAQADISSDGARVVFATTADDLYLPDTNGPVKDIVLYTQGLSMLTPVSAAAGQSGNGASEAPQISANGIFVSFATDATNLVMPDANGQSDVLVKDLDADTFSRASVATVGQQANAASFGPVISGNGRVLLYQSDATNLDPQALTPLSSNLFEHRRIGAQTRWASRTPTGDLANGDSIGVGVSADGGKVVFDSAASNLVAGDSNAAIDIFAVSRPGALSRISLTNGGAEANGDSIEPAISDNGLFIAFASDATNLVPIGTDLNGARDIFLLPLVGAPGSITRISNDAATNDAGDGESTRPALSANGNFVAFTSTSNGLIAPAFGATMQRVYVYDRVGDSIEHVSVDAAGIATDSDAFGASISDDGCKIAFQSDAGNLDPLAAGGTLHIFVRDRCLGTTTLASIDNTIPIANPADSNSFEARIAGDGNSVVFLSDASNLGLSDLNGVTDAYIRTFGPGAMTSRVSLTNLGGETLSPTLFVDIDAGGTRVMFINEDPVLHTTGIDAKAAPGSPIPPNNVFVRELSPASTTALSQNFGGTLGNGDTATIALSGDGSIGVFSSGASNLSPGDGNGLFDVYVKPVVIAGPVTCTWTGAVSTWNDPLAWSNCATGSGSTAGTPGAADTAIISSGSVDLSTNETVDMLQMTGGSLIGDFNLGVTSAFDWTSGTLAATAATPSITLSSTAISTWTGGDKFLTDRQLFNDGTVNWTGGLIHLQDTVIDNTATGIWNWTFNGPVESIDRPGGLTALVRNDGVITKSGTSDGEIQFGVNFVGAGAFQVQTGTLIIAGDGGFSGSLDVSLGATLILAEGTQVFDMTSTFTGAGDVHFGRPGPSPVGMHTIGGAFASSGVLRVEAAQLMMATGNPSINTLEILDPLSVFSGAAVPTVSNAFVWNAGAIVGLPGETLTLGTLAVSTMAGTPGDFFARLLDGRQLLNDGLLRQVQGNTTVFANGAQIVNASLATMDFVLPVGAIARFRDSDANPGNLVDNQGAMGGNETVVMELPFTNSGSVDIDALTLTAGGGDSGTYQVDAPGSLTINGHSRVFAPGTNLAGNGSLRVSSGGIVDLQGGFSLTELFIFAGSTANWLLATPLNLNTLQMAAVGASLGTQGAINIAGTATLRDGDIHSIAGVQPVTIAAATFFPQSFGESFTFTDIDLQVDGSVIWRDGIVNIDAGSSVTVAAGSTFLIEPAVGAMPSMRSAGGSPTFVNNNSVTKRGLGDAEIQSSIAFTNTGLLDIESSVLSIDDLTQNGGTAITQVDAGAELRSIAPVQVNAGEIRGAGLIGSDLNVASAVIRPGDEIALINQPGQMSIGGNLNLEPGSAIDMQIGGTTAGAQYDQLLVTGAASFDGTINIAQFGGFTPAAVDVFTLLQFASSTGSQGLGANPFATHELDQTATTVVFQPLGGPLVVTTTLDPGDGTCDIAGTGDGCTLREAITTANGDASPDIIMFNIPGPTPHTISPLTPLPVIVDDLQIDGYSQPGSLANTQTALVGGLNGNLGVVLSGANTTGDGLVFSLPAGFGEVSGMVINGWSGAGVLLNVHAAGSLRVYGSYIGTDAAGTGVPATIQGNGIVLNNAPGGAMVNIGSPLPANRNLISGQLDHGMLISAELVTVQGNLIGTDVSGLLPLPNGRRGIFFSSNDNAEFGQVGGPMGEERNVISANLEDGIGFQCAPGVPEACFNNTSILGNYIGVGVDGTTPLGNANGINVIDMTYGQVDVGGTAVGQANKIEFNANAGILSGVFPVMGGESNEGRLCVSGNSFANNAGPAIDFGADGRQLNDAMDADGGFNNGQNFPEISTFLPDTPVSGQFTIGYAVTSDFANALFPLQVEFYRAAGDEGMEFLGAASYLIPGATENVVLLGVLGSNDVIIATATDANCKTSEFSYYGVTMDITDDSPDPSLFGDAYSVEVTTTPSGPFPVRGDISVDDGDAQMCSIVLLAGDANVGSCLLNSPSDVGTFNLGAIYDDTNQAFGPAFDPDGENHAVGNPTTIDTFMISPEPSGVGDPYLVQVGLSASVGVPSGTVDVMGSGGENCVIFLALGAGQCSLNATAIGPQSVDVFYNQDPGFEPVAAMMPHLVNQASSTTQIVSDTPDPSAPGAAVTVQVQVQPAVVGSLLTPSGSVTVNADSGESCVVAALDASGAGSCDITLNAAGGVTLTANYSGDASFLSGVSGGEAHTVIAGAPEMTTTTITGTDPEASVVGQPYTVSVDVIGAMGGVPCGTVTITQLPNNDTCTATLAPATAPGTAQGSCVLTAPNAITKALLGDYLPGACFFDASQSMIATHLVNRAQTLTAVTTQTPNPSGVGEPITVAFAVSVQAPGAGLPTGTVTVTDSIDVCQATLPAASCQIRIKTAGNRTLTVSYSGDADFDPSSDVTTQQVVDGGADLSVSKVNDRCVLPGGNRTVYRIGVSNAGPDAVTNARVTDVIPAGLSNASWTCTASGGGSCVASGTGNIDTLVNLPSGATAVFSLSADVQRAPEIVVSNTANVQAPTGVTDPQLGNNSSTDSDPIGLYCDGLEDPFSD